MALSIIEKANTGILSEDCDNMNGNIFIAGKHSVPKIEYEKMIKAFFGVVPPIGGMEHRTFSPSDLQRSCVENCILFDFDPFRRDNTDINVSVAPHPSTTTPQGTLITGKYSIHLFRALQNLYQPQEYIFCKARTQYNGEIVTTLALAVLSAGGEIVYYGDLTNMYP